MAAGASELRDEILMEAGSNSSLSQDSLASLTAGDVLIRSTGVHREKQPIDAVRGAGGRTKKVAIAVEKLREVVSPCRAADAAWAGDGTPCLPPALFTNRAPCGTVTPGPPRSAAPGVPSTKGRPECLLSVEDSAEPVFLSQMDYPREAAAQEDPSLLLEDSRRPKDDVFISQYATGQKEALRAVLKQKTQNTPVLKEVKVQLLGNASREKKEGVGHDTRSAHREVDSVTNIAAATAAAIATTAPLLKVQNDLEAKVNSVSALLHKLQETDRQLQRVAEQQTNMKTQHEKPHCHERVSELEKQMNAFMVERIQHLEKLQEQQMNIQSHLISSAVNMGGLQQIHVPSSSLMAKQSEKPEQRLLTNEVSSCQRGLFPTSGPLDQAYSSQFQSCGIHTQKSPLKTPVPRRYAPEPVSKNVKISKKENPVTEKENIPKSTSEGEGRLLEHILNSQEMPLRQTESSKKAALNSNKMSWHSERDRHTALRTDSFPSFESSFQNCNSIEKTVKKADDLLQDLGQLRKEMHDMLQEANSWKSDMNDLIKSKKPTVASDLPEHHLLNKPSILQNVKVPKSILRDAERILRGVQNNKKVLEENLEAVIRAKDGDAMYTFINALTTNRDVLEEIRIRKTVDEWIKAISLEIQAEMARNDSEQVKNDQKVPWIKRAQNIKAMKTNKEIKPKNQKIQGCLTKKPLSAAKPLQKQAEDNTSKQKFRIYFSSESLQRKEKRADGPVNGSAMLQNEDYLCQVYGKPIYQGHRSTLKKAPYLRFNSPSPRSKLQRPKVIECVRGTKVKSARTQTCSHMQKVVTSPRRQHPLYALAQENQYLFSPSRDVPAVCGPLEGHLIPMAIPLGQTQISDLSLQPAGVVIGKPHPVTVTTSLPQVPPKPPVEIKKPNIAVIEMRSEKKDPPQLSVQVLPNVDIDSISSDSVSVNHVLPGSEPALPPVDAVIQDQEEERDEIPEFFEPLLELNGQFKVASPKYNGPLFPPVASAPQQSSDVLDELIQRRETIENRLINWVEQEIMAKIISGMYPVQKETVPSVSTLESEDSETVTSDIVEAAGGGGFQLFINAGVPVDSEMISHFVNEALSETIATMLGSKQAQKAVPATNVLPSTMIMMESLVPTPLPTPQATPPQTPPSEKELPPVKTPESSLSLTEMSREVCEHEKIKETGVEIPAAVSCVGTPVVTPVNTPPRTTTPSPPASEWVSKPAKMESPKPPNPWDDAELPLEEEKPSPLTEEPFRPKAVEMSVANDEEPEALILPSQQSSAKPFESLPCNPQVPSPVPTVSSGQSTQESSLTLTETETETADRHISEGEVLFSYGQMLAARALAEGGLSLPNLAESLTSTLQDANEMDYDPPSEGQVVRRLDKGYHRDPVLTLLAKLNQAPVAAQEEMYHLEDSDDSVGELSEGQRPRLTRAAERILMGHSVYMDHPTTQTSEKRLHQGFRSPSPGQLAQIGAEILGDADTSHGPMLMAELESQPVSNPILQAAQPSCRVTSLPEDLSQQESRGAAQVETVRPRVIHVRRKPEEMQQEDIHGDTDWTPTGTNTYLTSLLTGEDAAPHLNSHVSAAKVSVKLPSMNIDNEEQSMSSIHGDSASSGADTF
ncbi:protein TALPID3 isoform X9 [Aquila chrysaetos chrysaetos]|uniref:protein TALPID3 isoform X9 n=1 Tax=Aquila chrysaetos chrysaetos TaxID=223781 RepID=UPI001B7D3B48|nr:protein TALPID3 isoform X9 [Aquila chrysaetos chrysaetos]